MENRINHVIELANGKKYFILKQAIYMGENYFVVTEVNEKGDDLTDNFLILHEKVKDGKNIVSVETDPKTLEVILKYLDLKED